MKPSLSWVALMGSITLLLAALFIQSSEASIQTSHPFFSKFEKNFDPDLATQHVSEIVRFKTISTLDDFTQFKLQNDYLKRTYPRIFAKLERIPVPGNNSYSLLLKWEGSDPSLKPFLLAAHLDVVPLAPETEHLWSEEPFGGAISEGFVWGRGTLDDKTSVITILEAVEGLLSANFQPKRGLYLAFGHDEEISGLEGAYFIVDLLHEQGVQLEYVLDEGGVITNGIMKGVSKPIALIGISEKGYLTVELSIEGPGGHSSMPTVKTVVGQLSKALSDLETNQLPASITGVFQLTLKRLSSFMDSFLERFALENLWLFKPLLLRKFLQDPTFNAMLRTTTAITVFNAGTKDNVLPKVARALVNFRILPGDSIESVLEHIRTVINNPKIEIREVSGTGHEPSPISRIDSFGWNVIASTTQFTNPEAVISPFLVLGATDGRYYYKLTEDVYRFFPKTFGPGDLARIHGINERVRVEDIENCSRFYAALILNSQSSSFVGQNSSHDEL